MQLRGRPRPAPFGFFDLCDAGGIGSGQMGGAVGLRWAEAGHEILFSSRNPDELTGLVREAGPRARAGTGIRQSIYGCRAAEGFRSSVRKKWVALPIPRSL